MRPEAGITQSMTSEDFLRSIIERNAANTERCTRAIEGLTEAQLNRHVGDLWSVAQVLDHLVIANTPYLMSMHTAISKAQKGKGSAAIKHTFVASKIISMMPTEKNVPVPKAMVPRSGNIEGTIGERWRRDQEVIEELARGAAGVDLNLVKFQNPFVKFLKFNLADGFGILVAHADRHVQQIEERAQRVRNS